MPGIEILSITLRGQTWLEGTSLHGAFSYRQHVVKHGHGVRDVNDLLIAHNLGHKVARLHSFGSLRNRGPAGQGETTTRVREV